MAYNLELDLIGVIFFCNSFVLFGIVPWFKKSEMDDDTHTPMNHTRNSVASPVWEDALDLSTPPLSLSFEQAARTEGSMLKVKQSS